MCVIEYSFTNQEGGTMCRTVTGVPPEMHRVLTWMLDNPEYASRFVVHNETAPIDGEWQWADADADHD